MDVLARDRFQRPYVSLGEGRQSSSVYFGNIRKYSVLEDKYDEDHHSCFVIRVTQCTSTQAATACSETVLQTQPNISFVHN